MSEAHKPARILGAGPAGLTAAITLAKAGREVVVYERASTVGSRRAGDQEALEDFTRRESVLDELARWGVAVNFHTVPIYRLTCFGPGFRDSVTAGDSVPLMHFITRGPEAGSFDNALLRQAQEAGARVEFNRSATPAEVDIVAGGARRPRAVAVGYTFTSNAPNGAYVGLDARLAPGFYAYLAICDGRGTIATCAYGPERGLQDKLAEVVKGFHRRLDFDMRAPHYFAASATFSLPASACREGRFYAGEAAEIQDIWTCFGIRLAMATGHLAALSLLDGGDYDRRWRERCRGIMEATAANRALQLWLGDAGYRLVRLLIRGDTRQARALLHRYYNPTWYSALLRPFARRLLAADGRRGPGTLRALSDG